MNKYISIRTGIEDLPKRPKDIEDIKRKGLFLSNFYGREDIPPLKLPNGQPSPYALMSSIWGESIPTSSSAVHKLANKGKVLLNQYKLMKDKSKEEEQISQASIQYLSEGILRVPLAKKGTFHHDAYGLVEFSDEDFQSLSENFKKDVLGFKPYITYGHPVDLPYKTVDAELKKGELLDLLVKDDVLYGDFSSSKDTYDLVVAGEYEYSSPELIRNFKDKDTGDVHRIALTRVALTNSPFIPFKEHKIEALSQSSSDETCPQKLISFVIKLSTDINNLQGLDSITDNMSDLNTSTSTEEVTQEAINPIKAESLEAPALEAVTETAEPINVTTQFDIGSVLKEIKDSLATAYTAQIESIKTQNDQVIQGLKQEISDLSNKLTSQEQISFAFSNSLSASEKKARYSKLVDQGIPPAFVEKFSLIEDAISSNTQVIKLSNSAGEAEEKSILEAISSLLIDAIHSEPVQVEQFGQSISKTAASGLVNDMERLISINKEKVTKLTLGK